MQLPGFIAYTMNNLSRLILTERSLLHHLSHIVDENWLRWEEKSLIETVQVDPQKADDEISTNTRLLMKRLVVLKMTAAPFKSQL